MTFGSAVELCSGCSDVIAEMLRRLYANENNTRH
jgi:hypothetical protein